jgi:NitT/TauT family transport system ATP-binding protein
MTSVPGKIKETIDVPFARPRDLIDLRRTPEFNDITRHLWETLREEVQRAHTLEAGTVAKRGGGVLTQTGVEG